MAVLTGGLLGRVKGKMAGMVFGSARSRTGKVVTSRELVVPTNPNTASQQQQRGLFARALAILRGIGSDIYQDFFNRAIGQLPGFQSLMSAIMSANDGSGVFEAPPTLNTGVLFDDPNWSNNGGGSSGELGVNWSTDIGDNGTAADEVYLFCYACESATVVQYASSKGVYTRSVGGAADVFTGLDPAADYVVCIFFVGAGDAEGLVSKARFQVMAANT